MLHCKCYKIIVFNTLYCSSIILPSCLNLEALMGWRFSSRKNAGVHGFWKGIVLIHCYGVLPDFIRYLPLWKLTWHWKITIVNRRYIFKFLFFQCHVSFRGFYKRAKRAHRKRNRVVVTTGILQMGVEPKIGVGFYTPKWMVKIMENPIKMDDVGGNTPIFGNTQIWALISGWGRNIVCTVYVDVEKNKFIHIPDAWCMVPYLPYIYHTLRSQI